MGKEAEDELIDKMRDVLWRVAPLQPQRNGGELVCSFLGDAGAGFFRAQLLRVYGDNRAAMALPRTTCSLA